MAKSNIEPRLLITAEVAKYALKKNKSDAVIGQLLRLLIEQFETDSVSSPIPPELEDVWEIFQDQVIRTKQNYYKTIEENEARSKQAREAAHERWRRERMQANADACGCMQPHTEECNRMQPHTDECERMQANADACDRIYNNKSSGNKNKKDKYKNSGSGKSPETTTTEKKLFSFSDYKNKALAEGIPEEEAIKFANYNSGHMPPDKAIELWKLNRSQTEIAGGPKAIEAKKRKEREDEITVNHQISSLKNWLEDNKQYPDFIAEQLEDYINHLALGMNPSVRTKFFAEADKITGGLQ